MSLQELLDDLANYPRDNVTLEVQGFNPPGDVLNVNEIARFAVRIRNNGPLDMNNVFLHINGSNGSRVSQSAVGGSPFNFSSSLTTAALNLLPDWGVTTQLFYVQAPSQPTPAEVPLFELHIAGWDAGIDSMLRDAAGHSWGSSITFEQRIFAG